MKKFLIIGFLISLSVSAFSAGTEFVAKVSSSTVEVGQRFQITFTINSGAGRFSPPDFSNFRVLSGPNQSSSVQYINGKMSRTQSISYILAATEKGKYTIGSAGIESSGNTLKTKPIDIEVLASNPNGQNAQRNRQNQRKQDGQSLEDYVYLKSFVDKKSAYVGEKITVTYKLYSKLNLSGIDLESSPSFNGFWTQDLHSLYDKIELSRENVNGEIFSVAELQQTLLYPQRSGELTIDPLSMKVTAQVQSRRARSIFDQVFGAYENKDIIASSDAIKIQVQPLPRTGQPADFSGAVGKFSMQMLVSKDSVKANEALDIKITINGTGNLPLINAPNLSFPPDFEVYDPETKNEFKSNYNGSSGKKTFSYLVIPRYAGTFELDPFEFTYFDIASKQYKSIKADPATIIVSKGNNEESVVYSGRRKEDVELLNTDIRYIHINDLSLVSAAGSFYNSLPFYSLLLLLIVAAIVFYFVSRKVKSKNADQVGLRKSKANKLAKKRLSTAKKHLDQGEHKLFYEEISTALFGYYADKFNIDIADLSQEKILELLDHYQNAEEIKTELKTVLEESEMARFAPQAGINPTVLYEKSAAIISKTEALQS